MVKKHRQMIGYKIYYMIIIPTMYLIFINILSIFFLNNTTSASNPTDIQFRKLLQIGLTTIESGKNRTDNCTPPAIKEFPSDGLTREQRQLGFILIHFIIAIYMFLLLAIVCDDFFVPSIKKICDKINVSEDVAGATIMATASSSPELFINIVGTFITEGDLGVGTIVGSAVFNILAVPACCGLFANQILNLEAWPVTRDTIAYAITVLLLILTLQDGRIEWYEALILVLSYFLYILDIKNTDINLLESSEEDESLEIVNMTNWPKSKCERIWWLITWPINFVLLITIPDCRRSTLKSWYPLTFIMCIIWIASTSYIVGWVITVIGDTFRIPDSIMGLTFLAAGMSVPEAVSSVIVANQGHGAMGISNSIGSNVFDVLLCLGLPWFLKAALFSKEPGNYYVTINSQGLIYSSISLFSTLTVLYLSLLVGKFKLTRSVGIICLTMYMIFLIFASILELNIFFMVNLPICID
ncbi:sodium/potassium/calcium exchanger 3 isoform X2 [Apis florea]|uniref:sodium/potassium/calcium exchanger 3 isoform X2 n=1 Tax=Apis florea TaxID=7463 RepID=UPI000629C99B|nr:sodium/potassium/calcium exchanger 3 isoform X2 [Apis florea]